MIRCRCVPVTMAISLLAIARVDTVAQAVGAELSDEDRQLVNTLTEGLKSHHERAQHISGRMVISSYYSDLAIAGAFGIATAPVLGEGRVEDPRWAYRGVEFYDFTFNGPVWAARGARLYNSGFGGGALPGTFEADDAWPPAPPDPWNPPALCVYSDGNVVFSYRPREGRAAIVPYVAGDESGQIRREVYDQLMETRGKPLHKYLEEALEEGRPLEVQRTLRQAGDNVPVYRVAYRTGKTMSCRATYWIAVRGTDCAVIRYEDYTLKEDRTGYRHVVEANSVAEIAEGLFLPTEVTTSRYVYTSNEPTSWKRTRVMTVLGLRATEAGEPSFAAPWEWLPLAVVCEDKGRLVPGNPGYDPRYRVGGVAAALNHAVFRHPDEAPIVAAWDRPADEEAVREHAGPASDEFALAPTATLQEWQAQGR